MKDDAENSQRAAGDGLALRPVSVDALGLACLRLIRFGVRPAESVAELVALELLKREELDVLTRLAEGEPRWSRER